MSLSRVSLSRTATSADAPPDTSTPVGTARASVVMLVGRLASMVITFIAQVIVVRYLAAADYGALAWAMAVVGALQTLLPLGLDRVNTKFLTEYDERGDRGALVGMLLVPALIVIGLGVVIIVAALLLWPELSTVIVADDATAVVLVIVLALGPAQALDTLLENAFAVFARPLAIFVRRYVLHPGLRLASVLIMIITGQSVQFLATAYLVTGLAVTAIYALALLGTVRGRLASLARRPVRFPTRSVFGLALPALLSQAVALCSTEIAGVLLGHYDSAGEVAAFRAVAPLAMLNQVVLFSFTTLFVPAAGRLAGRGDLAGLARFHWRTAIWVMVIGSPAFLITVPFAGETTRAILGHRYAESAALLALTAAGYVITAAIGFNGALIVLLHRRRWLLISSIGLLVGSLVVQWLLIPRFGAVGAAVAVLIGTVAQAVLNQFGAGLRSPIRLLDRHWLAAAGTVLIAGAIAGVTGRLTQLPFPLVAAICCALGVALLLANRRRMHLAETFPELARIPLLGRLVDR